MVGAHGGAPDVAGVAEPGIALVAVRDGHVVVLPGTVTLPSGRRINGFRARPGWDPVTGWGTPNAQVLVPLLAKAVHADDGQGL